MSTSVGEVRLSKHEAAGNDFLVLLDGGLAPSPSAVRAVCDRHRGVGADGLLVGRLVGPGRLAMELYNADGSPAEMSGNGIRCLVDAAVRAGWVGPGPVLVETAAGARTVDYRPGTAAGGTATAAVDMGAVALTGPVPAPVEHATAMGADVGNPHLVVVVDATPSAVDLPAAAAAAAAGGSYPAGVNLEVVRVEDRGAISLRVHERGVGETLACGTGSCAAAAVTHHLGLTGPDVEVRNPGGVLRVTLAGGRAVLGGPVRHVADVVVATLAV